jgi:hypothetical protein
MVPRKIRNAEDARACLAQAHASGLTRAEWAREHDIDARSLNMWRVHLERRDERLGELRLVELVPSAPPSVPSPIVYRLRHSDFVIEVSDRFDDAVLGRLLKLVATC